MSQQQFDEHAWCSATDSRPMLVYLAATTKGQLEPRKVRLFYCAFCRDVWHLLTDERCHRAVEIAERYADGLATLAELARAAKTARAVAKLLLKVPDMYAAHAVCDATVDDRTMSTCNWPWSMPQVNTRRAQRRRRPKPERLKRLCQNLLRHGA